MKPDIFTKAVLTMITITLTVIACNQHLSSTTTAYAQSGVNGHGRLGDR